jgi:hypothetical protein
MKQYWVCSAGKNSPWFMKSLTPVPVLLFRSVLYEICEHQPDVHVRFRLIGEMWKPSFFRILAVTEKGIVLQDETDDKWFTIPDLNAIMQFEIDSRFREFEPHIHYDLIV